MVRSLDPNKDDDMRRATRYGPSTLDISSAMVAALARTIIRLENEHGPQWRNVMGLQGRPAAAAQRRVNEIADEAHRTKLSTEEVADRQYARANRNVGRRALRIGGSILRNAVIEEGSMDNKKERGGAETREEMRRVMSRQDNRRQNIRFSAHTEHTAAYLDREEEDELALDPTYGSVRRLPPRANTDSVDQTPYADLLLTGPSQHWGVNRNLRLLTNPSVGLQGNQVIVYEGGGAEPVAVAAVPLRIAHEKLPPEIISLLEDELEDVPIETVAAAAPTNAAGGLGTDLNASDYESTDEHAGVTVDFSSDDDLPAPGDMSQSAPNDMEERRERRKRRRAQGKQSSSDVHVLE